MFQQGVSSDMTDGCRDMSERWSSAVRTAGRLLSSSLADIQIADRQNVDNQMLTKSTKL
jgi:hypothetical protein